MSYILVNNNYILQVGDSLVYSFGRVSVLDVVDSDNYTSYLSSEDINDYLDNLKEIRKNVIRTAYNTDIIKDFTDPVSTKVFNCCFDSLNKLEAKLKVAKRKVEASIDFRDIDNISFNMLIAVAETFLDTMSDALEVIYNKKQDLFIDIEASDFSNIMTYVW